MLYRTADALKFSNQVENKNRLTEFSQQVQKNISFIIISSCSLVRLIFVGNQKLWNKKLPWSLSCRHRLSWIQNQKIVYVNRLIEDMLPVLAERRGYKSNKQQWQLIKFGR